MAMCEYAWTSFNDNAKVFEFAPQGNKEIRFHPTQKPIELYYWILNRYSKEGDKILDTHAYQHEYYTANLHRPTGKYYRQKRNGAVTECNGFTLYYEAKDLTPETMVTEKLTGCSARYEKFQDPEFIIIINDRMPTYPRACELPDLDNLLKERLKGDDK